MSTFDVRNESNEPITKIVFCAGDKELYFDSFDQGTIDLCLCDAYTSLTITDLENLKLACAKVIRLLT